MLERKLEPDYVYSEDEARDYNDMDHSAVNDLFTDDLVAFAALAEVPIQDVLDLGTATALIPIALCQKVVDCRVMAIDMSVHMLDLARYNIEADSMIERINLAKVDAKKLIFDDDMFNVAMSNSTVRHIPQPVDCLREVLRVTESGGILFFRDLMRPESEEQVKQLVQRYAGEENDHAQHMFADSLRAALSLNEVRGLVIELGFDSETVQATSDRHWTWAAKKP
jgi:ubiquinone/menaquinone biosynthesis C-methylase UbiE